MKRTFMWLIPVCGLLVVSMFMPPINFHPKRQPHRIQAVNSITHFEIPLPVASTNSLRLR